ncbi:fimbrial protein [Serratia quinivorans]|uniref:fimbrial protein n=1 Tax=Serratia quinivorans TaxID=137545 RepID=UPI002177B646|nr:fimbrial protein [Serratia quinivorans]CAI1595574.1 Fimbria A protein precursor [Serratia quinivorans]CAI1675073.1 Fimbria A protein precursor [Serratia quinivorans]
MKLNKIMMAAVLAFGAASVAQAADDHGHGTVTFTGSIIDAPCSIDPTSIDQTVDLGAVSNVALTDGGRSKPQNFDIKLVNCSVETGKTVTTTFNGPKGGIDGSLGMTGTAKGASIMMTDGSSNVIELGKATTAQALTNGNNTLLFSAYLQGNPDGGTTPETKNVIVPGDFKSVSNFTLAYP